MSLHIQQHFLSRCCRCFLDKSLSLQQKGTVVYELFNIKLLDQKTLHHNDMVMKASGHKITPPAVVSTECNVTFWVLSGIHGIDLFFCFLIGQQVHRGSFEHLLICQTFIITAQLTLQTTLKIFSSSKVVTKRQLSARQD